MCKILINKSQYPVSSTSMNQRMTLLVCAMYPVFAIDQVNASCSASIDRHFKFIDPNATHVSADSTEKCCISCENRAKCLAFSFKAVPRSCFLHSVANLTKQSNALFVCGSKHVVPTPKPTPKPTPPPTPKPITWDCKASGTIEPIGYTCKEHEGPGNGTYHTKADCTKSCGATPPPTPRPTPKPTPPPTPSTAGCPSNFVNVQIAKDVRVCEPEYCDVHTCPESLGKCEKNRCKTIFSFSACCPPPTMFFFAIRDF